MNIGRTNRFLGFVFVFIQFLYLTSSATEFLVYDETRTFSETENGFHYFDYKVGSPSNWKSPNDYYTGTWYFRYQILDVPSNTNYKLSTCIWADWVNSSNFKETCSGQAIINSSEGTYYYESSPSSWWKKGGVPVDFSKPQNIHQLGVVLWTESLCNVSPWVNPNCWGERAKFLPMRIRVTVVAVSQGSSFSGWGNYGSSSGGNTNKPPSITSNAKTNATEGLGYAYQVTANDPNGDALEYNITNNPGWLSINKNSGYISGTPSQSNVGSNNVTIRVQDGKGGSDIQSFVINVKNANDPPSFTSTPITTATEDVLYKYQLAAKDPNNDNLTYSISNNPGWFSINSSTGYISGTPSQSNIGANNVTVKVQDGKGGSDSQSFVINVKNANDPPYFTSSAITTATEDVLYKYQLIAKDPNNDNLTYSISKNPGWLVINKSSGFLSGTPLNKHIGNNSVQITVSDDKGGNAIQSFTINVKNINDKPTITSNPSTNTVEDKTYTYQVTANDPDIGDNLTYILLKNPDWLTINKDNGLISGIPKNNDVGKADIQVKVEDLSGANDIQSFELTITNSNDPPAITSNPILQAIEDQEYKYQVKAEDIDIGDAITFVLIKKPAWLGINNNTGLMSGIPLNDHVGSNDVQVQAKDQHGGVISQAFQVNVSNTNDQPVIVSKPITKAKEDSKYTYKVVSNDPDLEDKISYTLTKQPEWLTIDINSGIISGTPQNEDVGNHSVQVQVSDLKGLKNSQSFVIDVLNTNDAPVITSAAIEMATEDVQYQYIITATDVDIGDIVDFSILKNPGWLSIDNSTGLISGIPLNKHVGNNAAIIQASDGKGGFDTQSYTIVVKNINDPPYFTKDIAEITFNEDDTISIPLSTYHPIIVDPDHSIDDLSFSVISGEWVTSKIMNKSIFLFAENNWNGRDIVMLTVSDGLDSTVIQVSVNVLPINDAPQFLNFPDSASVINDQILELDLDDYISDIDSDASKLLVDAEYDSVQLFVTYDSIENVLQIKATEYKGSSTLLLKVYDDSTAYTSQLLLVNIKTVTSLADDIQDALGLDQNYPNPFKRITTIPLSINANMSVSVNVYDLSGNKVHVLFNGYLSKGSHEFELNADTFANGIYLYSLESDKKKIIKKLIITK